jgi:tetratricopeptide (TPR) repeat protein
MAVRDAFLAVLLLAPWSSAAEARWTVVTSPNFQLYTSAGGGEGRRTIEYFEQVRDFFMTTSASRLTTRLPVTIVLFKNRKEYQPYAPNKFAGAFFTGDRDQDFIVMNADGPDHSAIAVHEYMHLLIRHTDLNPPVWLNEGIAEVYSTLRPYGGKIFVGSIPPGRANVLMSEKWLPLGSLLDVKEDSPEYNEKERVGMLYAQSWLLAHMLMLDDNMRPGFNRFLQLIAEGESSARAFDRVWSLSVEQMEKRLRDYSRSRLNEAIFNTKLQKVEGLMLQPASDADVEIALASLASLIGRRDEALARLKALVAQHSDNVRVHEALAVAAWRASDVDLARKHFQKAVDLNTPNWKTWLDLARVSQGLPGSSELVVKALQRSIELNGTNHEARLMLAEEYTHTKRYREAISTLNAVLARDRETAAKAHVMRAYNLANLDLDEEARKSALRGKELAKEPRMVQRADDVLRFLDTRARLKAEGSVARPVLSETPQPVKAEPRFEVTGVFKELNCDGERAVVHVVTTAGPVRLVIQDPSRVSMKGTEGATLTCGPQPPNTRISVEYIPLAEESGGTQGAVRTVEILPKHP